MISFYDMFMFPLEHMGIKRARKRLIKNSSGNVLEIGSGSGVNLKYYDFDKIKKLTMIDRQFDKVIFKKIGKKNCLIPCETILMDVEDLMFDDNTFDTVIFTLVFCTVNDVLQGLKEIKRVLKPDGKMIFIEHVLPKKKGIKYVFSKAAPVWSKFSNGCNLDRDFKTSLQAAGFKLLEQYYDGNTVFFSGIAVSE